MPLWSLADMRVMTWNLWWRYGPWRRREPGIVAGLREVDPDLVALQEVWAEPGRTQADVLGDELGFPRVYTPTRSYGSEARADHDGIGSGIAILSRWPIRSATRHELPSRPGTVPPGRTADRSEVQSAILAVIDSPHGEVRLCTTTLDPEADRSGDRVAQVEALLGVLDGHDAVLAGDFNAEPDSPEVRLLAGRFGDAWPRGGAGSGSTHSERRIDYVFTSGGVSVSRAWLAGLSTSDGTAPSDHAAVVAELAWG